MMPLQTDSKWSHIRGWGCHASALLSFLGLNLTTEQVENVIRAGMRVLINGIPMIRDNNAPIDIRNPESWWRCFVVDAPAFVEMAGSYLGKRVHCKYLGRSVSNIAPEHCTHAEIEYRTNTGSHFIAGDVANGKATLGYNPDPKVKTFSIISYRWYSVEAV